ncbi:hypothetical protein TRVL_08107 [Trypanosoma vivax]|uniref:Uncharacterized protein n=1 Tax=Trypanosoma vivax (strain Y486) TaxID=1055687 RepID=G0U4D0_TRYVY|nr:hypothetical protein TRVL_08107 [Trypanosoma vivax]CCC52294.1 conserved hypothetical protein [Trypanosoma vivax Y486]
MSSRFHQKYFLRCGHCKSTQRYAKGYRPIPNPILFDSDAHCRSYHRERQESAGMVRILPTCRCNKCLRIHSDWKVIDFQQFLDIKLAMSAEEKDKLLWPSAEERCREVTAVTPRPC